MYGGAARPQEIGHIAHRGLLPRSPRSTTSSLVMMTPTLALRLVPGIVPGLRIPTAGQRQPRV